MGTRQLEVEFMRELLRVLHGDSGNTAGFFRLLAPTEEGQLTMYREWLRTLPSGVGEQELEARLRARFGPPHDPGGQIPDGAT